MAPLLQVKNLYIRNLMPETSEEQLWVEFERAAGKIGSVERVKRVKDFAFIHFYDREPALQAMEIMNGKGAVIYYQWRRGGHENWDDMQ